MGYVDRTAAHEAHYPIPVKPVLEAIERWLVEEAERSGYNRSFRNGIASPLITLAARADMSEATCARNLSRFRNESKRMTLTTAERFINATYGDELWEHPELKPFRPSLHLEVNGDDWRRPEEQVDGEHGIRHWAWRVVKDMTPLERRAVAVGLDMFEVEDHSRFASGPKPRWSHRLDPHPYAKLEQPFGAKAKRAA